MDNNTRTNAKKSLFSVIIPVFNEAETIQAAINDISRQHLRDSSEVIVVDGDTAGSTIKVIDDKEIIAIISEKGRARQMNAGAAIATGEILLFLHADTKLPVNALEQIRDVLKSDEYVGGAFDLAIDSDKLLLKYIASRASSRSRQNRIPYGDQAIFIRKSYFDRIGGYAEIPLMEDVDLMRRIKKNKDRIYIFRDKVTTSPRRWQQEGIVYTTVKNQILIILYYIGVSPRTLAKLYWRKSNGHQD
jgi:rSAM/selenodomain-associated transferase 2